MADAIEPLSDPERPERELTWRERSSERKRLRAVRADRRRQVMAGRKEQKKDKKRK